MPLRYSTILWDILWFQSAGPVSSLLSLLCQIAFFISIMIQYQHSPLNWVWFYYLIAFFYVHNYLIGESRWYSDSCEVSDDEKPRPLPLGLLCFPHVPHSIVSQAISDSHVFTSLILFHTLHSAHLVALLHCTVLECILLHSTKLHCVCHTTFKDTLSLINYTHSPYFFYDRTQSFLGLFSCIIFTWYSKARPQTRLLSGRNSWRNTVRW